MAKRKRTTPTPPFPPELDRNYFGAWFSGFCDGESSFTLYRYARASPSLFFSYQARFSIQLRHDDRPILELSRSFLGCGTLEYRNRSADPRGISRNPGSTLWVGRPRDLAEKVIPHFQAFPLLAKKRRDFEIWKRGVELMCHVGARKVRSASRVGVCHAGTYPKWSAEETAEYLALCSTLKAQRAYNAPAIELPPATAPRPPAPESPGLFDGLP